MLQYNIWQQIGAVDHFVVCLIWILNCAWILFTCDQCTVQTWWSAFGFEISVREKYITKKRLTIPVWDFSFQEVVFAFFFESEGRQCLLQVVIAKARSLLCLLKLPRSLPWQICERQVAKKKTQLWQARLRMRKRYWIFLLAELEKGKRLPLKKVALVYGALARARGKVCPSYHNLKKEEMWIGHGMQQGRQLHFQQLALLMRWTSICRCRGNDLCSFGWVSKLLTKREDRILCVATLTSCHKRFGNITCDCMFFVVIRKHAGIAMNYNILTYFLFLKMQIILCGGDGVDAN